MDMEKIQQALQRFHDRGNVAVTYGCIAAILGTQPRYVAQNFLWQIPPHLQAIVVKNNGVIGNGAPLLVKNLNRQHFGGPYPAYLINDPLEFLQIMQESAPANFEQELKQELKQESTPASKPDLQLQVELERLKNENLKLQLELQKLATKKKSTTTKKSKS